MQLLPITLNSSRSKNNYGEENFPIWLRKYWLNLIKYEMNFNKNDKPTKN